MTNAVAPVAGQQRTARSPRLGEWLIIAAAIAFFAFGYLAAEAWPFRAALFPQIVSTVGLALSLLRVIGLALQTVRGRRAPVAGPAVGPAPPAMAKKAVAAEGATGSGTATASQHDTDAALVDEEAEEDQNLEYIFATAGGRAWIEALAWIVFFFVAFFVLGAFVAVPLFALVYLRFSGGTSWLAAAIYAAVTGLFIFLVFRQLVYIPLPESLVPFLVF